MDLDELQSVQSRERQTDSLQQLRESFYQEAGEFVEQLKRERERVAERADDPWNAPEVGRLSDDIDTAEQTVEAIYERRVGKIVKMASLAAADMPTEDDGLTAEERSLFDTLVGAIEDNRARVEAVLDGADPADVGGESEAETTGESAAGNALARESEPTTKSGPPGESLGDEPSDHSAPGNGAGDAADRGPPTPPADAPDGDVIDRDAPDPSESVDAASLMGDDAESADRGDGSDREPSAPSESSTGPESPADPESSTDGGTPTEPDPAGVDRTTIRVTDDVGEIFGVDDREYELSAEDVVTLPAVNADPLVESDAAERLE